MSKFRMFLLAFAGGASLFSHTSKAVTFSEDFSSNPLSHGWQVFGDTNLFQWAPTNKDLKVTWDSSRPNSYFYHRIGMTVTRHDDFSIAFDLRLSDIASGVEPGKTGPMQLGFGLLNLTNATSTNFMRGAYGSAPNIAEFDYYTYGYYISGGMVYPSTNTATPSFISGVNSYDYCPSDLSPYDSVLPTNQWIHIAFSYTASNQTAVVVITTNGVPVGEPPPLVLDAPNGFQDSDNFTVDTFSVSSYSSVGDDYDSVLAHGSVANVTVTVPPPVRNLVGAFSNGVWRVQFDDHAGWLYTLERTTNLLSWTAVSGAVDGNGTNLFLLDANSPGGSAFYRVSAERP